MLGDEEALGDLVGAEVLVEQEQHFDLAGGENARDLFGNTGEPASVAHALEESARDPARQRRIPARDAAEEGGNLLGGLGLQQVARCTGADRGEEVLLRIRRREDDDLGLGGALAQLRKRRQAVHARHRQVE